jgi:hypothetical protein
MTVARRFNGGKARKHRPSPRRGRLINRLKGLSSAKPGRPKKSSEFPSKSRSWCRAGACAAPAMPPTQVAFHQFGIRGDLLRLPATYQDTFDFSRPLRGLACSKFAHPPLKRRAIFIRPAARDWPSNRHRRNPCPMPTELAVCQDTTLPVLHDSKSAIRFRAIPRDSGDSADLTFEPFPPPPCLTLWLSKLKRELDN